MAISCTSGKTPTGGSRYAFLTITSKQRLTRVGTVLGAGAADVRDGDTDVADDPLHEDNTAAAADDDDSAEGSKETEVNGRGTGTFEGWESSAVVSDFHFLLQHRIRYHAQYVMLSDTGIFRAFAQGRRAKPK